MLLKYAWSSRRIWTSSWRRSKEYYFMWYVRLIVILFIFGIYGCSSLSTKYRVQGDKNYYDHFSMLPENPYMHKIITVTVEVHIVGSRNQFSRKPYRNPQRGVMGYYWSNGLKNEIWLLGKEINGKAVPCKTVLGHEFWNCLVHKAPYKILSPYELIKYGY